MLRTALGTVVLSIAMTTLIGCDRGSSTSSPQTSPPAPTAEGEAGQQTTNTVAETQPATSSTSNLPGLPSVNGTSVKGLTASDAAAVRLLDSAKNNLDKGDVSKAKTLLDELKGMYDSLSPTVKSQVDELATKLNNAAPPAK